jgi:hypothetical protein
VEEAVLLRQVRPDRHHNRDAAGGHIGEFGAQSRHRALTREARLDARD